MGEQAPKMSEELAFLMRQRQAEESVVLAQAVREGIRLLYREALIEEYLLGRVPRSRLVDELGPESVDQIDHQRDALKRDLAWGLEDG